jgi:hypothetical protein
MQNLIQIIDNNDIYANALIICICVCLKYQLNLSKLIFSLINFES